MVWTDNLLIPKGGDAHDASRLMDFYYQPAIAPSSRRRSATTAP